MEIRTERLVLLPFAPEDEEELHALFTQEEVRRYLLDGVRVERDWIAQEIRDSRLRFGEGSAGLWSMREAGGDRRAPPAAGGPILGFAGFRPFFDPPQLQLLYGLRPPHWGRGLATEAARAVVQFAFRVCGFESVTAATDVPNRASVRVMEALGMSRIAATKDGAFGGTLSYALERSDWEDSDRPGHDDGGGGGPPRA